MTFADPGAHALRARLAKVDAIMVLLRQFRIDLPLVEAMDDKRLAHGCKLRESESAER